MTGEIPFEGHSDKSTIFHVVGGRLPKVHDDGQLNQVVALANLMNNCWSLNPSERPTATNCEREVFWQVRKKFETVIRMWTTVYFRMYSDPGYSTDSGQGQNS